MTITIPAACLEALGGLRETDAPVVEAPRGWGKEVSAVHPLTNEEQPRGDYPSRLLLPASAPALLQVLARHVGLSLEEGEVPAWSNVDAADGYWYWYIGDLWRCFTASHDVECDWPRTLVPTLTPDMGRMRALAEVVVWLARVERCKQVTASDAWVRGPDEQRARLDACEQRLGLPPWTVEER